jgi:DNA topoisomerase IB
VNDYLRSAMCDNGEGFTAKDFRTWGATLRAIAALSCERLDEAVSERTLKRCVASTAAAVAEALGNTAAVCRKSYINPVVFDAWRTGAIARTIPRTAVAPRKLERLALSLLRAQRRSQVRR